VKNHAFRWTAIFALAAAFFLALVALVPSRTTAGTLSTGVIGMFPKQVGEFAYADLKAARKLPWFPAVEQQLLPPRFKQFEQFLSSAGIDPNSQVDELAWGGFPVSKTGSEDVVGVAQGSFDPASAEMKFKSQKIPMIEFQGYHMYANGSGTGPNDLLFTFLDSNTAAFGHRAALEQLINVRMGGAESLMTNDRLFPLINEANGSGTIWAVLDQNYTHMAMQQLVPQASQFPQAAVIINRLHSMLISVDADSGANMHFQAVCDSVDDANLLAAALQAGLMYRRYQDAQTHPEMAGVLDNVRVSPSGDRLKVDAPISADQLQTLIRSKTFAVPM
jgi:hypothetical protein